MRRATKHPVQDINQKAVQAGQELTNPNPILDQAVLGHINLLAEVRLHQNLTAGAAAAEAGRHHPAVLEVEAVVREAALQEAVVREVVVAVAEKAEDSNEEFYSNIGCDTFGYILSAGLQQQKSC